MISHRGTVTLYTRGANFSVSAPTDAVTLRHGRPGPEGSHGSIDDRGNVNLTLSGKPARGREDEFETAERLIARLNLDGGVWGTPLHHETEDDPVDVSASDGTGRTLNVQVVRVSNEARWSRLGQTGRVEEQLHREAVADELFEAIKKKSTTYGPHEIHSMTLAVDVGRLPSHTFKQAIESLEARHGGACKRFGFESVWVVGARLDLVYRIS